MQQDLDENIHQLVAQKVRWLRFMRGWTQAELALATGLHRSYISEIERGLCNLRLDNVQKLATGLGVSVPTLFSEPVAPDPAANDS